MTFKIRADITLSKELAIEASDLGEAMDKAQKQMEVGVRYSELTFNGLTFQLLSYGIGDERMEKLPEQEPESENQ